MSNRKLTAEDIDRNYKKFCTFIDKLGERKQPILNMLDIVGERFALAPASAKISYHNCFPGGLVDHSLRVLVNAVKLCKTFEFDVPQESIIITALFHDLGKVGDETEDYYVEQTSEWHREKLGELYTTNNKLLYMMHSHRSIWLLQRFGVQLSQEEFLAIMLHDGQNIDANKQYSLKECTLTDLIHFADYLATKQEKIL